VDKNPLKQLGGYFEPLSFSGPFQVMVPEFTVKDSVTKIIEGRIYKAVEAG